MEESPQPAITNDRTAEAARNSRRARRGTPNRISPTYNRVRLFRSSQSEMPFLRRLCSRSCHRVCVQQSACHAVLLFRGDCRWKSLVSRLLILLGCPSTAKQRTKNQSYFFLDSFFASLLDSLDSLVARLDSPGRYSSCSAAAKAFSNPTISSPGRSVSKDSTSLRSCSSE